jgi:hypothetical protein
VLSYYAPVRSLRPHQRHQFGRGQRLCYGYLAGVNTRLLEVNMPPVIKEFFGTGKSTAVAGKEFSLNYVKYEQGNVTRYLKSHLLSAEASNIINDNFAYFEFMHSQYTIKYIIEEKCLDFRREADRIAIGQATVNLMYDPSYGKQYLSKPDDSKYNSSEYVK